MLHVAPSQALVYLNEKLQGKASTYENRTILLRPGKYRLKLVADGFYPEYLMIEVGSEVKAVEATLTAVPEPLGIDPP